MAKRRGRKVKFNLTVGEDPSLWRFANAREALLANTDILSKLIRTGERGASEHEAGRDENVPMSESA